MLRAGADKVSFNTAAVERSRARAAGADEYGAQCIVVAIDARAADDEGGWEVVDARRPHADRARRDRVGRARSARSARGEILLTSMDRDGTKAGYDIELLQAMGDAVNVPVIASGGVGTLDHLYEGVAARRRQRGARGVDLPLRPAHRPGSEGLPGRPRVCRYGQPLPAS